MPQELDFPDTPEAIAEVKRQAAAERSRRYRAAKREEGKPDTNAVDGAIAEAVSFMAALAIKETRGEGDEAHVALMVDITELHRVAAIMLVRDGAKRQFARQAISARMLKRTVHDQPHSMPSRRLSPSAATIERPVNGEWLDQEIGFIRKIVRRWRDAATRTKS